MRSVWRIAVGVLLAASAIGCAGDDADEGDATSSSGIETSETSPGYSAEQIDLALVDCERVGALTTVDPGAAADYVPEDQEIFLNADGQASFALQVLSCTDLVTDAESHGPGYFATAWIRIVGPEEPPTLPADTDLEPAENDYFHPVMFQTDNTGFQAAVGSFGVPITLTNETTFDPTVPGSQTGSAVDDSYDPPLSYSWSVENANERPTGTEAVHTLLGPDDAGEPLTYFGVFQQDPGFVGNPVRVDVEPGSWFAGLLGTGYDGIGNGAALSIEMVVFRTAD